MGRRPILGEMRAVIRPSVDRLAIPRGTRRRLGLALLGYMLIVTLIITLSPFDFAVPSHFRVIPYGSPIDGIANVVLFVPLGFFFRARSLPKERERQWPVFAFALGLSSVIELTQLFEETRYCSPADALANASGAWIGAHLQRLLARRLTVDARFVGALALDLPLTGLVYLLVPLLWLDGLSTEQFGGHFGGTVSLAGFGVAILVSMYHHHLRPRVEIARWQLCAIGCLWFVVGAFPGLVHRPALLVVTTAGLGCLLFLAGGEHEMLDPERRFEGRALRHALPLFAAYLLARALAPTNLLRWGWSMTMGVDASVQHLTQASILGLLENVSAFTLLGYIVAEWRGRREVVPRDDRQHILGVGAVGALAFEFLRGWNGAYGASLLQVVAETAACGVGCALYHLQRDHVRAVLSGADAIHGAVEAASPKWIRWASPRPSPRKVTTYSRS